jgi:hypothetical protein
MGGQPLIHINIGPYAFLFVPQRPIEYSLEVDQQLVFSLDVDILSRKRKQRPFGEDNRKARAMATAKV